MKAQLSPGARRINHPAYRGNEPYIFVSYSHADSRLVLEEIRRFNEAGYHVWYDEGITPGNEWTDEIAEALSGCALFVIMVTPNSAVSTNVQNEVNYALDEGKPFLAIHLLKTTLQGGLKLRMNSKQAILKYGMPEEEYVWKVTSAFKRLGLAGRDDSGTGTGSGSGVSGSSGDSGGSGGPARGRRKWLWPAVVAAVLVAALCLYALGPWRKGNVPDIEAVAIPAGTEAPEENGAPATTDAATQAEAGDPAEPASEPTEVPISGPTEAPAPEPTEAPTPESTEGPTSEPTEAPTLEPTEAPTPESTEGPTPEPTIEAVSAAGLLPAVEVTGPVMEVTLFNGEVIEGPLSSVQTYFTLDEFRELSLVGITHLTHTREEGSTASHIDTDDPFSSGIDWDHNYAINSSGAPDRDEQDQSFSISTVDGTRLISLYAVREIDVTGDRTLTIAQEAPYERGDAPSLRELSGKTVAFTSSGTVRVTLKDGTAYTSYPDAFGKIATANLYLDPDDHPGYAQTRDFWIEEARALTFTPVEGPSSRTGYFRITGELANGEPVSKYTHSRDAAMRIFTLEKGIVSLPWYEIDRIEVDTSQTPDFSNIRTGRITLTDGTVFELPVNAMEYEHYEGGGLVVPHPVYDYFFYTGSAEFGDNGYAEDEQELPFSAVKQIEFHNEGEDGLDQRAFPATVTYRDGSTEEINFRFYNYYGNSLDLYCPGRFSIDLHRRDFPLSLVEFG